MINISPVDTDILHILLIEDDHYDRELIVYNLKHTRYHHAHLGVVDTIEDSVQLAARHRYDLIISDLSLPDTQGVETILALLKHHKGVPLVLLTGLVDFSLAREAIKMGVQDYLIKDNLTYYAIESAITHAIERQAILQKLHEHIDLLQEKNVILDQLTRALSHDYRAPVNNIMTLLTLMDEHPEDLERYRQISFQAAVLLISNMEETLQTLQKHQEVQLQSKHIKFHLIWDSIYTTLYGLIEKSKAHIITNFAEAEAIDYPPIYLRSALQNLVSNALKYRDPERELIVKVQTTRYQKYTCLIVRDNGLGIDLETQGDKLFAFNERIHQNAHGAGQGLYNLKKQVELLDGYIEVDSELGKGSEFRLYLVSCPPPESDLTE